MLNYSGMVKLQLTLRSVPKHSFSHWKFLYFRCVYLFSVVHAFTFILTAPLLSSEMVSWSQIYSRLLFIVILRHSLLEL